MGPLGGFERAAAPARLRARPVHFKSGLIHSGPASESTRPPPGAPRGAARLSARRRARGLRAALVQVGESLTLSTAVIASCSTVNELTRGDRAVRDGAKLQ